MTRNRRMIGLLVISLLPMSAAARTTLEADVESLSRDAELFAEERKHLTEEMTLGAAEDLLPDVPGMAMASSSSGTIDRSRDDRAGEFVQVKDDGRSVTLRDVPAASWFAPYIRYTAERQILAGYRDAEGTMTGLFGPGDNVTVEQLAKIAVQSARVFMADCPATQRNLSASGSWSIPYVACAEHEQWVLFGDGGVDVKRNATRAEVVATMLQAFDVAFAEPTGTAFKDVLSSLLYAGAVERAKADGIIAGYVDENGMLTGMFGPDDPVTRAEVAKIVSLAVQIYGQ